MDRFIWALSAEAIAFQDIKFKRELIHHVENLRTLTYRGDWATSQYVRELETTIRERTGFRFHLELSDFGPAVEIPLLDRNHPFIPNDDRLAIRPTALQLLRHANTELKGTVNIMTGKVTGIFTERIYTLYLPWVMFQDDQFSAAEVAAAMLHEIGHLFTYCEYAARTVTTNQVLAGIVRGLAENQDPHEREIILKLAKDALRLGDLDTRSLSHVADDKVVETVVITHVIKETRSELGSNLYDLTTWEALSDQYATRQGAGVELVTVLHKIEHYKLAYRSSVSYYALEGLKLSLFMLSYFSLPIMLIPIIMVLADAQDASYDTPETRFKRIRNQLVEGVKSPNLSNLQKNQLLADIDAIDEVLATVHDREQFFGWLYNLVSASARKRIRDAELAKQLEAYASNDFFTEAMRLQNLAQR